MMFTPLPMSLPPTHHRAHTNYTPPRPSPLSSSPIQASPPPITRQILSSPTQSSNPFAFSPSMSTNGPSKKTPTSAPVPFSKRAVKTNPLMQQPSQSRETRRKLFLKRVREDSEDRRWSNRGGDDEMLRTIWCAEERRRLERKEREGTLNLGVENDLEEDDEAVFSSSARSVDEEMADEVAQREDEEIEAMLSMMGQASPDLDQDMDSMDIQDESMDTPYGSDDEDYDSLFIDAIQAAESHQTPNSTFRAAQSHQAPNTAFKEPDPGGDMMDES